MSAPSLAAGAAAVQRRSRRSKQKKPGASDVGVCRRRTGYKVAGAKQSNPGNAGMAAMLGTWIHAGALAVLKREFGAFIEVHVENAELRGSVDAYFPDSATVEDIKTKSSNAMEMVRSRGPAHHELLQTHLYADLLRMGFSQDKRLVGPQKVDTIRLRYISRDNGDEYLHEQAFDRTLADEAWAWLSEVLTAEAPEDLPRDQDGPGLSMQCNWCPFLDTCWGPERADGRSRQVVLIRDDEDAELALRVYDAARAAKAEAEAEIDKVKASLEATPDGRYGGLVLKWTESTPKPKPDVDRMVEMYEEADLDVPLAFPKPRRTISVRRAKEES